MSKLEKERLKRILDAKGVDYTSIIFIRKARSTWSRENKGLCVRLSCTGGCTNKERIDDEHRMEEQLTALAEIEDFHIVTNERTRKGSGYWTPVRGGGRVYAAIESYTVAGYVKLVNIPAVIAESWTIAEHGLPEKEFRYLRILAEEGGGMVVIKSRQRVLTALYEKGLIVITSGWDHERASLSQAGLKFFRKWG